MPTGSLFVKSEISRPIVKKENPRKFTGRARSPGERGQRIKEVKRPHLDKI